MFWAVKTRQNWVVDEDADELLVTAPTNEAAPAGHTVTLAFHDASFVSGGVSLATGEDVRIVFWNGTGHTDIDRVLDPPTTWNSAGTLIDFALARTIAANTNDAGYYLYLGNQAAPRAPASWANVFWLGDDFSGTTLSTDLRGVAAGTATITLASGEVTLDLGGLDGDAAVITSSASLPADQRFLIRHRTRALNFGPLNPAHHRRHRDHADPDRGGAVG